MFTAEWCSCMIWYVIIVYHKPAQSNSRSCKVCDCKLRHTHVYAFGGFDISCADTGAFVSQLVRDVDGTKEVFSDDSIPRGKELQWYVSSGSLQWNISHGWKEPLQEDMRVQQQRDIFPNMYDSSCPTCTGMQLAPAQIATGSQGST